MLISFLDYNLLSSTYNELIQCIYEVTRYKNEIEEKSSKNVTIDMA